MASLVTYHREGPVATIVMDDGKVNALSPAMLSAIGDALDRASTDGAVVVVGGRDGVFSAGFDLNTLRGGGGGAVAMLRGGFELAERLLSFPTPVVVACTGHAIAMGSFLLLAGDYRLGPTGSYRITANEVAIGLTVPIAAIELCRARLSPAAFTRGLLLAEVFSPEAAVEVGYLDRLVAPDEVVGVAQSVAAELAQLDLAAHAATKRLARAQLLGAMARGLEAEGLREPG